MFSDFRRMKLREPVCISLLVLLLVPVLGLVAPCSADQAAGNKILEVRVAEKNRQPVVNVETEKPVGFRYTVYDSQDPRRIIVDFRDMALGDVPETITSDLEPVTEIRVTSFDLTSGKLSRIEILLAESSEYDVAIEDNLFAVKVASTEKQESLIAGKLFADAEEKERPSDDSLTDDKSREMEAEPEVETASAEGEPVLAEPKSTDTAGSAGGSSVSSRTPRPEALIVEEGLAKIETEEPIEKYRYFTLTGPTRLVIDVYGGSPYLEKDSYPVGDAFKRVRIGNYDEKTRFVFDSASAEMPEFGIDAEEKAILVSWNDGKDLSAPPKDTKVSKAPVAVESVEFSVEDDRSVLDVELSGKTSVVQPERDENIVSFGIRNATISRSLRRIIDASVFPSSVRLVTPYTVQHKERQDVMFAVELKGPVSFDLKEQGGDIAFVVENASFAEEPFVSEERKEVSVPEKDTVAEAPKAKIQARADESQEPQPGKPEGRAAVQEEPAGSSALFDDENVGNKQQEGAYTGQRISLVFDNTDIRNILQLIAEVSDLNIIATEEVKGSLSIRLIDVPWDQALDIILDIKDLGMIKRGNVVRILPKGKIREMEREDLQAAQTREELEPLVTEVISVNYTDLGSITGPAGNILSDRGKITEDPRNKQLIVTDIPSRVEEVRNLVSILDTPEKQVVIEARIVEANSSFSRDLGVSWGLSYDANGSNDAWEADEFNLGLGGSFVIPPPSQGSIGSAGLATGITFGRVGIDSTTLDLRISALESSGHGKVISTPRVTTLNGKEASISQGTKIPFQSVGDEGTQTEFIDAVLSLDVTPVINPDESIILDIAAANSSVGSIVPTGSGSAPSVDTKEATTQVLVQNGETTVIGGIFVEDEDFAETGVPLLRSIPILGHLFKSTTKSTIRNELLIFITPRIVTRTN